MSDKVEAYINNAQPSHQQILSKLRVLILNSAPAVKEDFKNGVPWYEDKFYLVSLKDHVNMGFALGNPKIADQLEGKGKFMRHLKFYSVDDINEKLIAGLIKQTEPKYED